MKSFERIQKLSTELHRIELTDGSVCQARRSVYKANIIRKD